MTYPIRTKSRTLRDWYASEPERFQRERSPRRTIFWAVVGVVGIVLTIVVLSSPGAVAEALGGRRRAGMAILGAFVIPAALIVLGVVMQFAWVHRFRVQGGDVVGRDELFVVPGSLDVSGALKDLAIGAEQPDGLRGALGWLDESKVDPRAQTGQQIVVISTALADRRAFVGVLRMDATQKGVLWIDAQPFEVSGTRFFDARELRATV